MPPKRQRSTRGVAKKSMDAGISQPEPENANRNVEQLDSEPELPSDPLATETNDTVQLTAESSSVLSAPPVGDRTQSDLTTPGPSAQRSRKILSQPKHRVRRSQASLQERSKTEDERKRVEVETKAAEEAARARREGKKRDDGRGRGRGSALRTRGRGGYMGEREPLRDAVASGIFGSGQASDESKRRKRFGTETSGSTTYRPTASTRTKRSVAEKASSTPLPSASAAGDAKIKQESGTSAQQEIVPGDGGDVSMLEPGGATVEDGGYISSDADEGERRLNVEDLGVVDLTQDDSFAPVRVVRVAHKERALGINADGATNQDGDITIDANDTTTATRPEKRRGRQKAKDVEISSDAKPFHGTYSDSEDDAERKAKIKRDPEGDAEPVEARSMNVPRKVLSSSTDARRKTKEKALHEAQDYQTRDELDEWDRHQNDLNVLRSELGSHGVAESDGDGDTTMLDLQRTNGKAEDRVYLFQFPPVLPDLSPIVVKPDPERSNHDPEGMQIDHPITISDEDSKQKIPIQASLPSGAVGKLKVHASGRVTLDWGGTSLCLGMGTKASFLQDVLVAKLPESKNTEDQQGLASSMGQVKGKFVVTPDWEEILK